MPARSSRAPARARRAWATSSASGGSPQPVGGVEAALGEVGHGTHAGQPGLQDRVGGVGRCAFGQAACPVQLAGLRSGLGGQREPAGVGCRVGGELYRALGGGRRGRVPASGDRLGGGALQRGGRLLVRSGCRGSQVPRPPVGVGQAAPRVGERAVHALAAAQHRALVHRRGHQRMAEPDRAVGDNHQPGPLRRAQVGGRHPQRRGRRQHHCQLPAALRRRDQQQGLGRLGQPPDLTAERLPQPVGQPQTRCRARPGGGDQAITVGRRQLDQPQRVAPRLGQDTVADLGGQPGAVLAEQRRRRGRVQPPQPQLGQARGGKRPVVVAGGDHHRDPLAVQPSGRKHQRLGRGPVQPVRVVDQAHQPTIPSKPRQQRQHRQANQQAVVGPGVPQPERRIQRVALWRREG